MQPLKGGSEDRCIGRSRGGLTTKIHALVDAEGRPVRLELSRGQAADAPRAASFLETVEPSATVLADKAYDTDGIRSLVASKEALGEHPAEDQSEKDLQLFEMGLLAEKPR